MTFEIMKTAQLMRSPPSQMMIGLPKLRLFMQKMFIVTATTT